MGIFDTLYTDFRLRWLSKTGALRLKPCDWCKLTQNVLIYKEGVPYRDRTASQTWAAHMHRKFSVVWTSRPRFSSAFLWIICSFVFATLLFQLITPTPRLKPNKHNQTDIKNFKNLSFKPWCVTLFLLVYLLGVYLSLHHGWSLCAQHFDSLEDVHRPFVTHPLQDNTQSDEDTCPPHTSTAATRNKHFTTGAWKTPSDRSAASEERGMQDGTLPKPSHVAIW